MKVIFYIDGQNVHHSLEEIGIDSYAFNFRKFCEDCLKNRKAVTEIHIKYYGALFPREIDQNKHECDSRFYDRLQQKQNIIIRKGKFNFDRTGKNSYPPREKGVDVLLAVDLIFDGFYQSYDQAFIFSDDTDLIPAIEKAKTIRTNIKIHNISFNPLHDFKNKCDSYRQIYKNVAKKFIEFAPPETNSIQVLANKFSKNKK